MAKRTKSARKAAKSVRRSFLRAKNDSLSLIFCCPFFFARQNMFIYIYISIYKSRFPQFKGVSFPQFSPRFSLSLSPRGLICKKRDTPGVSSINLSLSLSPPNPKQKPSAPRQRPPARKGYKVWTEPEKVALTAGVAKYGPGNFLLFFVVEKGCFLL